MDADYHAHSGYSDGAALPRMVAGAAEAGLEAVGFADHCSLTEEWYDEKVVWNRNFDLTHERRRDALGILGERHDLTIYDAVEVDYEPRLEAEIGRFLDGAGFDYALGSVHYVDGREVFPRDSFADESEADRRSFVDTYYDAVVSLVESELFDVVAHLDLVENHPDLHGLTTDDHRRRVTDALADSRTVPELNAGRVGESGDYDRLHPDLEFLDHLVDRGVAVTVGTDSHGPEHFGDRAAALDRVLDDRGIDPVAPPGV
ncbi:histidinol-phosphatase [Halobacteriales archaeon QS_8_69_26]|nr:MAG: histidinol-phosphatase [Halobacteriales archaeon QS_8_69_26]